jgi:hypothetical protein
VVDLLENTGRAGVDRNEVLGLLTVAVEEGRFDPERLRPMAEKFGTRDTLEGVERILASTTGR